MNAVLTTVINEAQTPAEWAEAASLVEVRIRGGMADAGLVHHLMARGWVILDAYTSRDFYKESKGTQSATVNITIAASQMATTMARVLATEVGESGHEQST